MLDFNPPEPATEIQFIETPGLPHSREAEEAVVGGVLISPDTYFDVAQIVRADDFYIHRLRFVWESFIRLEQRHVPIDSLTVSEELDDMGRLDEIGGPAYLTSLFNQVPTTLHAEAYAEIIKATSTRRKLLTAANTIATLAYDGSEPIENVVSGSEQAVFQVTDKMLKKGDVYARDAVRDLYDHVDKLIREGNPPGILTGSIDFDKIMGGLVPGLSGLIGARPGVGKTALILTWIAFIESRKNPPAIVLNCMEMTTRRVMGRIASIISGVSAEKIKNGTLDDDDWPAFNHAIEVIGDWPLTIIDERDPLALLSRIKHDNMNGTCDILFNDYVGKFEAKADSRVRQVGIASSVLSKIAVKVEIPVVTNAQVSRAADARAKDSELMLSDLKESGDLEQDADWVLFLNPCQEPTMTNIRNCKIAKNRDGAVGAFDLIFRSNLTKFDNVACRSFNTDNYRDISGERE